MSRIDLKPDFDYPSNPEVLRRYVKDLLLCGCISLTFAVGLIYAVFYSEVIDKFFGWLLKALMT
jgi:hypothetical protein